MVTTITKSRGCTVTAKKNPHCFEFILEFGGYSWITAILFSISQDTEIWISQDTSSDGMGHMQMSRKGSAPTTQWPCRSAHTLQSGVWLQCKDVSLGHTVRVYNRPRYWLIKAVIHYIFISASWYSQVKKGPHLKQFPLHCRFIHREKPSHGRERRSTTHSAWSMCQLPLLLCSVFLYLENHCPHSRFIFLWKCLCSCKF